MAVPPMSSGELTAGGREALLLEPSSPRHSPCAPRAILEPAPGTAPGRPGLICSRHSIAVLVPPCPCRWPLPVTHALSRNSSHPAEVTRRIPGGVCLDGLPARSPSMPRGSQVSVRFPWAKATTPTPAPVIWDVANGYSYPFFQITVYITSPQVVVSSFSNTEEMFCGDSFNGGYKGKRLVADNPSWICTPKTPTAFPFPGFGLPQVGLLRPSAAFSCSRQPPWPPGFCWPPSSSRPACWVAPFLVRDRMSPLLTSVPSPLYVSQNSTPVRPRGQLD